MEFGNEGHEPKIVVKPEIKPVMTGGEKYSAEPVIEKSAGELWYWLGQVTRKISEKRVTLPMRSERAKMLMEAKQTKKITGYGSEEIHNLREEYWKHKKIEEDFVNQKDISVDTKWGNLEAKYVILNENVEGSRPPLVIVPGASNGMESVDSLVRRLAERYPDRKIIAIGYPDAPSGRVTEDFCKAVKENNGFGPHARYFESAMEKICPGEKDVLGYSAGGGIVQEMDFKGQVNNLILVNPGGSKQMNDLEFKAGLLYENIKLMSAFKDLPGYVFVDDKTKDLQKRLKLDTWQELGKKCCIGVFERLSEGLKIKGRMLVVSGTEDKVTKAADEFNEKKLVRLRIKQPNLDVSLVPGSPHAGPYIEPDKYIDRMDELLK
jgi:pimeloyl-ACP methyl ester carboxylesterase